MEFARFIDGARFTHSRRLNDGGVFRIKTSIWIRRTHVEAFVYVIPEKICTLPKILPVPSIFSC